MARQTFQILVTVKVLIENRIEVKRLIVPVCNDYELETFIDDLDFRFDCILETHIQRLISGIN